MDEEKVEQTSIPLKIKLIENPILSFLILSELFIMLLMSFPRLDDLTWGSSMGLDRLGTWFAGYNGRYVGNLIVIALTRLPEILRAGAELGVLCILFYYVYRLLSKKEAFCGFVLALLLLPLSIWQQSVVWTAGFANYTTSAVVMLYMLYTYYGIVMQGKKLSKGAYIAFVLISFLGQLILENTTFFVVFLAGFSMLYGIIKKKRLYFPTAIGLLTSVCGALLMFSNTSYHSAIVGDGKNYKQIVLMPLELIKKYQNNVVPHLVQNNHVFNIAISLALILLWATKKDRKERSNWWDKLWCFLGVGLLAFFVFDASDSSWLQILTWGKTAYMVVTFLYATYILATISLTVTDAEGRQKLLLFAWSQVILAAPLIVASPLSARCFFQNSILWAMLFGYMVQILLQRYRAYAGEKFPTTIKAATMTQVICICYLAFLLCGQSTSWRIQSIRQDLTQIGVSVGAETIVLPEVPWPGNYCYGANLSNTDQYWLNNYKRYYKIPATTKLEFMDYYKWKATYGEKP